MGSGLAEVALLAVLTIIVLPCCFFTLLALLDRFERNLGDDVRIPPAQIVRPVAAAVAAPPAAEPAGADVVSLPIAVTAAQSPMSQSPVSQSPAAATG